MYKKFCLIAVLLIPIYLNAQNAIGLPEIINYHNIDYKGGTQSWKTVQDNKGIVYFANNEGLLSFDGSHWKIYPMPNKTVVRSVAIGDDGKIYVGAQDEFGYFFPNSTGQLCYHTLKGLIMGGNKSFADIWDIIIEKENIYFRATDRIFQLAQQKMVVYKAPKEWLFMGKIGNQVVAQDKIKGLMVLNGDWQTLCPTFAQEDMDITAILKYEGDTVLVTTLKNGIFLLFGSTLTHKKTEIDDLCNSYHIFCAAKIDDSKYVIGTSTDGFYIIGQDGKMLQHTSRKEGLQNSNVLSVFIDRDKNTWASLDNGIDLIASSTAIKHIYANKENELSSYAIKVFKKQLFIGTSNGLFSAPLNFEESDLSFSKGDFKEVANTRGQVWNLTTINDQLLMGHNDGLFLIKDNEAMALQKGTGTWLFQSITPSTPTGSVVMGTYTGLQKLKYLDGKFVYDGMVDGLYESLRFLAYDQNSNTVWASHPYRGIYKLSFNSDKTAFVNPVLYTQKDGLPSTLGNYVYYIKNKIVIATEKGIYEYDKASNRFSYSDFLSPVFKHQVIKYLTEDDYGNIWFVSNGLLGVIDYQKPTENEACTIVYFPELTGKILGGFEYIYPYNKENIFIASTKGILHLNYDQYSHLHPSPNVLMSQVRAININKKDSIVFNGYFANGNQILNNQIGSASISMPNGWNSFHFEYASTLFAQQNNIEFSYQLVGFDKIWSEWSIKTEKDYTNLPFGTYTFLVKARTNMGVESTVNSFTFHIKAAWYQTVWAVIIYVLLFMAMVFRLIKKQQKKFALQQIKYQEEQIRLQNLHQLEIEKSEKEIMKLQNDKLETEVDFKNKELANVTMHLVERGKILSKIKEELKQLPNNINLLARSDEYKGIVKLLNEAERSEDDWEHFAIHFDKVHNNFLTNIKTKFPILSPTDLKLCAYLKMNLTSKEIASLMNITLKGVEVSRYRLRKKLNIKTEENLFDFLVGIN